jgi:hypothetical protein
VIHDLGPGRIIIVSVLFVAMVLNAFRRRPLREVLRWAGGKIAAAVVWARLLGCPPPVRDPCHDCLARGMKKPRQVATVEFGQPTCLECAAVRRRAREIVLAEAKASKALLRRA